MHLLEYATYITSRSRQKSAIMGVRCVFTSAWNLWLVLWSRFRAGLFDKGRFANVHLHVQFEFVYILIHILFFFTLFTGAPKVWMRRMCSRWPVLFDHKLDNIHAVIFEILTATLTNIHSSFWRAHGLHSKSVMLINIHWHCLFFPRTSQNAD